MKKLLLMAIATIALLLSSCSKDDASAQKIMNIWQLEFATTDNDAILTNACGAKMVFVFGVDEVVMYISYKDKATGTCKYKRLTAIYKIKGDIIGIGGSSYKFNVGDDTLVLIGKVDGEETLLKFRKISQAQLNALLQ